MAVVCQRAASIAAIKNHSRGVVLPIPRLGVAPPVCLTLPGPAQVKTVETGFFMINRD
jgi:hypothetical protein